jgi:hypothetical protein
MNERYKMIRILTRHNIFAYITFTCSVLAICSCSLFSNENQDRDKPRIDSLTSNMLWYREPAKEWIEALPIGNGRLGGMIFGRTDYERVQLNEESREICRSSKDH